MPVHSLHDGETGKCFSGESRVPASPPAGLHRQSQCVWAARGSRVPCVGDRQPKPGWILPQPPASSKHDTRNTQCRTFKQKIGNSKHIHVGRKLKKTQDPKGTSPPCTAGETVSWEATEMHTLHFPKENVQHGTKIKCYFFEKKKAINSDYI